MQPALVFGWLLAVLLLAALASPLSAWIAPDWPDEGASIAPAVALAVPTLVAFWVGQVAFGPPALLVGLGALAGLSALAVRAGAGWPGRAAAAPLAVFLAAFLLVLWLRAVQPTVTPTGGEQFLDFALLQAVRRTAALPPQDVWFAGEPLRYYYGGPVLGMSLAWLTDTPPQYAFNLLHPTLFAALATGVYGVTGAIARARGTPHRLAGLLGAGLVTLAGHLATPLRGLSSFLPRDLAAEYASFLYVGIQAPYDEAVDVARFLGGGGFSYWEARRVIPNTPNVFPFWTYVNGDLRPHMYAGPFLVLAVALAFAYYRTPAEARTRRRLLLFGALPAVGGLLGVVNSFDLPVVVGLAWLAVLFAPEPASVFPARLRAWLSPALPTATGDPGRNPGAGTAGAGFGRPLPARAAAEVRRWLAATLVALVVAGLAVLPAAPLVLGHPPVNRGIALFGPTSNLGGLLLVFGGFLAAFALWLGPRALDRRPRRFAVAVAAGLALLALSTLAAYPAVGLFVPLVAGGWWLLRTGRAGSFAVVLVVAGAGLALVPEFAYADVWPYDPNAPRWNTVYKLTLQVWTVWGIAAGVALAAVLDRARRALAPGSHAPGRRTTALVAGLLALVLVALLAAFPALAVAQHAGSPGAGGGDISLNATAGIAETRPAELAAARWLRHEATGQPTIVAKPTAEDVYSWDGGASAASTLSGLPAVAGWEHAAGYHGPDRYAERVRDVDRIYNGSRAVAVSLLRRYDVRYVYVGPAERAAYGSRDFAAAFEGITVAYRNRNVTIYEVDRTALARNATRSARP